MRPIEGSLYTLLMDFREAMRRCRDAGREDLVVQLQTLKDQILEMKRRTVDI